MALPAKTRAEIAQLFKGHQQAYETAQGGPWNPLAGDYICRLCKPVVRQEKTKKAPIQTMSVLRIAWAIVDGDDAGREFGDSYTTMKSKQSDNHFGLGRAKAVASLLASAAAGEPTEVSKIEDAIALIYEAAMENAYLFKLRINYNENNTFPNISVLDFVAPGGESPPEGESETETEPEA